MKCLLFFGKFLFLVSFLFISSCDSPPYIVSNIDLSNESKLIVWSNTEDNDRVELVFAVKTGSLQEKDHERGYAHFVEHLAFNNTKKYPNETMFRQLESLGMPIGMHSNATTSFDNTIYRLSLKNPTDETLEAAIEILSQWAMHVQFDQEVINAEKDIIKEEWRLSQPQELGWQANYLKAIHKDSPYANRLPIGDMKVIEQATAKDLEAFYKRWYQPDNATIIVAGAVDAEKIQALVEKHFSEWKSTEKTSPEIYNLAIDSMPEKLILADSKIDINRVELNYYLPYSRPQSKMALLERQQWVAAFNILKQRLKQRLQATKGKVSNVNVSWNYPSPDVLEVRVFADVPGKQLEVATRLINEETQRLIQYGITEKELATWVQSKLKRNRVMKDTPAQITNLTIRHVLYDNPLQPWGEWLAQLEDYLPDLTAAQVNTTIGNMLSKPPTIFIVHNPDTQVPDQAQLTEWLASSTKTAMATNGQSDTKQAAGNLWEIDPDLSGEIVEKRTVGDKISEWTLSNGIQVYHRFTNEKPKQIWYKLVGLGGMNELTEAQSIHARLALETIGASGLRDMSGPELGEWLNTNNIFHQPFYSFLDRGLNGQSQTGQFAVFMNLLHISLTEGRVAPEAWQHNLGVNNAQLKQLSNSHKKPWFDEINETLFSNDVAFRMLTVDEVNAIEPGDLEAIYQQKFAGAQNYKLFIVGDIAKDDVEKSLLKSIATVPEAPVTGSAETRIFPRVTKAGDIVVKGSKERTALLIQKFTLDKQKLPSLTFAQLAYLEPWLRTTLMEQLREKDGLVYSVNLVVESDLRAVEDYTLTIQLACDPDNVKVIQKRLDEILTDLKKQLPKESLLSGWWQEKKSRLSSGLEDPSQLINEYAASFTTDLPLQKVEDVAYRSKKPSPQQLQEMLQKMTGKEAISTALIWLP